MSELGCLTCGGPIEAERAACKYGARRSLYCTDDCMRASRPHGALAPRPAELELLDRGVACKLGCLELAAGWLAGCGPWSGPYCLDCFELVLDRLLALAIAPRLGNVLPPLVATSRGQGCRSG